MNLEELIQTITASPAMTTFLVAMVPVVELRGAIPLGVSLGLTPVRAMGAAILGNLVPVPFLILTLRQILLWMKRRWSWMRRLAERIERRGERHRDFIVKWEALGLAIFVAIPLPGTGAWTAAILAVLMDIRLSRSLPAIALGVVAAGLVVTALTFGVVTVVGLP